MNITIQPVKNTPFSSTFDEDLLPLFMQNYPLFSTLLMKLEIKYLKAR